MKMGEEVALDRLVCTERCTHRPVTAISRNQPGWEKQSLQGQQGPKMPKHPTMDNKKTLLT